MEQSLKVLLQTSMLMKLEELDLVIGVDYKDDIKKAKEVLTAVINSNEKKFYR